MAKIALFLPDLNGGGAERSFMNLARGLFERGHTVDLVLSREGGDYADQVAAGVRVVNLGARVALLSARELARYLRRERPDILFSALNNANIAAIWGAKLCGFKIPVVISIRNNLSIEAKTTSNLNLKMMPYLMRAAYPMADRIVAVSNGVADDLSALTGIPRERVTVIYNPVVTDDLFDRAAMPVEHPWLADSEEIPVVLAAGRLNIQKDYATLIHAFAKVQSAITARLLILGEGEYREQLTALARGLGISESVSMPGFVDNPFSYMNKASLFVLSSLHEGLPGVLIQALACGCPVVSTNCPSGPSEILQNGKYGALVPVGDVDALAAAMELALGKPKITPPCESWKPYLLDTAARQYESLIP